MPLVPVKTRQDIFRVGLLPCGHTDRPHHLLAILLRSWTTGNRFERASPGHDVFTFLVDFNSICSAQIEQIWVDNRWWVARYQDPTRSQGYVSRNIQVRVKVDPEKWSSASATPEDARWSAKDMVLQLPSRMGHVMELDQILISFKYVTASQINFALELPTLLDTQCTDEDDAPRDRILVFAGHEGEEDWKTRLGEVLLDLRKAASITPPWTIKATITTRRIFNQLISVLEAHEIDGLTNNKHLQER
jgi:hypothetical protein